MKLFLLLTCARLLMLLCVSNCCTTATWDDKVCPVEESPAGVKERVCTCQKYSITAYKGLGTQKCDGYKLPIRIHYEVVKDESP